MNKTLELQKIAQEIEMCSLCKNGTMGKSVPGEGNADAKIVFVGEAPGRTEAATGRPFVGRSGKLLRQAIQKAGLKEEDVFITSAVKYLPLQGTPSLSQIVHGKEHLFKQLEVIKPKVVVLLGFVAAKAIFGKTIPIAKEHGKIIEKKGIKYFLSYHPAAILRFPKYTKLFEDDFLQLSSLNTN